MKAQGFAVLLGSLAIAQVSFAAPMSTVYECKNNGLTRLLEVIQDLESSPICEVWYDKPQETATRQRLWFADSDAEYCTARADEFVQKLTGWGWSCNEGMSAAMPGEEPSEPMPEPEPAPEPAETPPSEPQTMQ